MPLDVNGYNETFKAFADFAKQSVDAGDAKAIARSGGTGKLAGRTIQAATGDRIGNLSRSYVNQGANNIARHLFKKAIVDMFGSESAIPPSVKNAMKLSDYGKGRAVAALFSPACRAVPKMGKLRAISGCTKSTEYDIMCAFSRMLGSPRPERKRYSSRTDRERQATHEGRHLFPPANV